MKFHESTYKGQQKIRVVTCPGVAKHTNIKKPDTKFNAHGDYKTSLIVTAADAQPLIDRIDALAQEALAGAKSVVAGLKGEAKAKAAKNAKICEDMPYRAEVDEDGNETGNVVFRFKAPAVFKMKDETVKPNKISVVDAKGKASAADVWGGSVISVQAELRPFPSPGQVPPKMGCGVSLRLEGVQIIELRTGGGSDRTLFGQQEGYSAEDEPADTPQESLDDTQVDTSGEDDEL